MALKISPAYNEADVDFDYLHLRVAVNSAPETNASPFGVTGTFRAYKKNGTKKLFAPTDKIGLLKIDIPDIEAKALEWAQTGRIADAQLLSEAMTKYQEALALFIEDQYPELTVTVE